MITDGVGGLLVPCGDIAALTVALQRLDTDPALRARLGAAALDTVRRRASTPSNATARRWLRTIAARTPQPTFTDPEAGWTARRPSCPGWGPVPLSSNVPSSTAKGSARISSAAASPVMCVPSVMCTPTTSS